MQNYEIIIVAFLGVLAFTSIVMLVAVVWLLRQIQRNVEAFMDEFRKNTNMQSKTIDRSFAETNGELKKISYRLDNIAEQLHRIQELYIAEKDESNKQDRKKRGGAQ